MAEMTHMLKLLQSVKYNMDLNYQQISSTQNYVNQNQTDLVFEQLLGYVQLIAEFARQRDICSANSHLFQLPTAEKYFYHLYTNNPYLDRLTGTYVELPECRPTELTSMSHCQAIVSRQPYRSGRHCGQILPFSVAGIPIGRH